MMSVHDAVIIFCRSDDRFISFFVERLHSVAPEFNFQEISKIQNSSVRVADLEVGEHLLWCFFAFL